jgi:hypothetical protein
MTTRTYAAEAMGMAGAARVRVLPCSAQLSTDLGASFVIWSSTTGNDKHGRLRRLEVSHQ